MYFKNEQKEKNFKVIEVCQNLHYNGFVNKLT